MNRPNKPRKPRTQMMIIFLKEIELRHHLGITGKMRIQQVPEIQSVCDPF
jgi:hypothetical protein